MSDIPKRVTRSTRSRNTSTNFTPKIPTKKNTSALDSKLPGNIPNLLDRRRSSSASRGSRGRGRGRGRGSRSQSNPSLELSEESVSFIGTSKTSRSSTASASASSGSKSKNAPSANILRRSRVKQEPEEKRDEKFYDLFNSTKMEVDSPIGSSGIIQPKDITSTNTQMDLDDPETISHSINLTSSSANEQSNDWKDNLYFVQLPPQLPISSSKSSVSNSNTSSVSSSLSDVKNGELGTLLMYKSGKVELCIGNDEDNCIRLDVSRGVPYPFHQDIYIIDQNDNTFSNLGVIQDKLVCSLNDNQLL